MGRLRLFLLVLLMQVEGLAIVIRDDLSVDAYADLAGQEAFRGLLGVSGGSGLGTTRGSGVLLNDEWALTAAHVVWDQSLASLRVQWGGGFRVVDEVVFPGGWSANPGVGLGQGSDLALLRLAAPFAFGTTTPLASGSLLGEEVVMLGSGRGGNGLIGAFLSGGEALGAMNLLDRQLVVDGGGLLVTDFDGGRANQNSLNAPTVDQRYYDDGFVDPLLSEVLLGAREVSAVGFAGHPTAGDLFAGLPDEFMEGTTAAGDSGGPWFVQGRGGEWSLAGVTSWGVNPLLPEGFARGDSRYGDVSFATDLTWHREWINSTIPEPEMASSVVMVLGLAVLRRRRSPKRRLASPRETRRVDKS